MVYSAERYGYIYRGYHIETGKSYIGLTNNFNKRVQEHLRADLDCIFHEAIRKHRPDKFRFEVIERCPLEDMVSREIFWISSFDTFMGDGYNSSPGGGGRASGFSHSEKTRKKMVKSHKKRRPHLKEIIDQSEEIIRKYNAGSSITEITKDYECSRTFIKKILLENGIKLKFQKHKEDYLIISQKYKEGSSISDLSIEYNYSENTIRTLLKKSNTKVSKTRKIREKTDEIIKKYQSGFSARRIAKEYNSNVPFIILLLKEVGVYITRKNRQLG